MMPTIPESTKLTFNEYQTLSAETAVFPRVDAEMADGTLKVQVSASKLAGIVKKIYRDNNGVMTPEAKLKLALAIEAVEDDLDILGFLVDSDLSQRSGSSPNPDLVYPLLGYFDEVGELTEKCLEGDWESAKKELGDAFWYGAQVATKLLVKLGAVVADNLHKLFSRKERGVLKGSGDNR